MHQYENSMRYSVRQTVNRANDRTERAWAFAALRAYFAFTTGFLITIMLISVPLVWKLLAGVIYLIALVVFCFALFVLSGARR